MTRQEPSDKNLRLCPECGGSFTCGIADGQQACWCFQLPNVLPVDSERGCLCPTCLQTKITQNLNNSSQK